MNKKASTPTIQITREILPYEDGSGHAFTIHGHAGSQHHTLTIGNRSECICFTDYEQWHELAVEVEKVFEALGRFK